MTSQEVKALPVLFTALAEKGKQWGRTLTINICLDGRPQWHRPNPPNISRKKAQKPQKERELVFRRVPNHLRVRFLPFGPVAPISV